MRDNADNKQVHRDASAPPAVQITRLFLVRQEAVVTEEEPLPHRSPKTTTASSNYRNSTGVITLPPVSPSLNKKTKNKAVFPLRNEPEGVRLKKGEAAVGRWVYIRLKATTAGTN